VGATAGEPKGSKMEKKLRGKQKVWADAYLSNGNNKTEASRKAKYKGDDNTLCQVGRENLRKPHIKAYVDARQLKDAKNLGITRETLLQDIRDIMSDSKTDGQHSVRMKGIELMTKMLGLNEPEKIEVSGVMQETEPTF
jgi:phage terminase small subunit